MSGGVHSAKHVMHSVTISILQNILMVVDSADDICIMQRPEEYFANMGGGTGAIMKSAHISAVGLLIIVFYLARCSTTYCTVQVQYCTIFCTGNSKTLYAKIVDLYMYRIFQLVLNSQ